MFFSDAVRHAMLDAIETTIGAAPILRIYNGTPPADESTALSGNTLLAEGTLPSDWLAAASAGAKAKAGTWTLTGQSGAGAGTDATFGRIYRANGTTCDHQFTVGETADAPEMVLDNKNIANAQVVTVSTFALTAPH
jgi:hypothetical protein